MDRRSGDELEGSTGGHCGAGAGGEVDSGGSSCQSLAAHRPWTQRQPPPQSRVPLRHSAVQATSRQSGAASRRVHALGWQQAAGTQSASVRQGASPTSMRKLGEGAGPVGRGTVEGGSAGGDDWLGGGGSAAFGGDAGGCRVMGARGGEAAGPAQERIESERETRKPRGRGEVRIVVGSEGAPGVGAGGWGPGTPATR